MGYTGKEVKELIASLKSDRTTWESNWQETSDYVVPNKNDFLRIPTAGEKKGIELYDSTAVHSNQLLAGALHGMLTNPSAFWFGLSTGDRQIDQRDDVRKWLDRTAMKIHGVFNNSNFQTEIHEVYLDLGSIGTSVLYIEPDVETRIRFSAQHLGKCYIMENSKGMVDTVFRCFSWTLKQAMEQWEKTMPQKLKEKAAEKPNEKMEFIHAVYPRSRYNNQRGPKNMRYASCYYVEWENEMVELEEKGYRTFPYAVPRWSKSSGETYGRSPGMNALPDIKMVNAMMETVIKGAQKTVDPPLMAPDDGFVRKIKLQPGGVSYYRAGTDDRIAPLITNSRVDFGQQVVADVRTQIRSAFFVDQLQLNQGPQMTATEVMQRTEEKLRLMGPVLGRQHSELLKPLIERAFDILQAQGDVFDPAPAVLRTKPGIEVQYTSAIAKVQQQSEIVNLQKAVAALAPIVQVAPDTMDIIDTDQTARFILDKSGVSQDLIRDKKSVDAIRQGRAQAEEQHAQEKQALAQSEIAANVAPAAKAISESVAPSVA